MAPRSGKFDSQDYYFLNSEHTDPQRLKKEREKARKLKKSQWWLNLVNKGVCHYCQKSVKPTLLTMDHIVPLARGGKTQPGNVVPCCPDCNRDKKLDTPVDQILRQLQEEKKSRDDEQE